MINFFLQNKLPENYREIVGLFAFNKTKFKNSKHSRSYKTNFSHLTYYALNVFCSTCANNTPINCKQISNSTGLLCLVKIFKKEKEKKKTASFKCHSWI